MTAKSKSERFRRLISHGFFAPELPPCFVSEDLAKYRYSILFAIEALPPVKKKPAYQAFLSQPSWFYFPRYGRDDRKHGVINPISYLLIAKVAADNFVRLRAIAKKSGLSASPPVFDWSGPRALMRPSVDLRDDFRVDLSSRREQFVSADIRAFFHSIYTHAIPWAIYGKPWAKLNRALTHYGNLIDLLCRNAQDGQTIGLPVGPDTSRLIAEVVASAMDVELRERLKVTGQDASRYIDDYTIGTDGRQSGESLIAAVRQAAAGYELELNNDKSAIHPTSIRQNSGWKQAVLAHVPRPPYNYDAFQRFLYEVGRVCDAHPEINVEKFAFQNARSALVWVGAWKKVQSNLINAYRRNTSLVSFLVEILILRDNERHDVDRDNIKGFLEQRLPALARENRTGEIIWLLFLALRLRIVLPATCLAMLFEMENAMVALLVAEANSKGLISGGGVDFRFWNQSLNDEGLRSPMWLFAYESVLKGINPVRATAFIEHDQFFSLLYAKRVSFLSIEKGLTSMAAMLRNRRTDNDRVRRLREDYLQNFEVDIDDLDLDDLIGDEDVEY